MAWTSFFRDIFTKLYRCDSLIASLSRNSLLSERIMKSYRCTPHSFPAFAPTNAHPLLAVSVDTCLRQSPDLLSMSARNVANSNGPSLSTVGTTPGRIGQIVRQDPDAAGSAKPGDKPMSTSLEHSLPINSPRSLDLRRRLGFDQPWTYISSTSP